MSALNNLIKIIFGLILVVVAIWFGIWANWFGAVWMLIKGGIILLVIFIGLVLLLLGFSDLK
jgi:hypothetical protein